MSWEMPEFKMKLYSRAAKRKKEKEAAAVPRPKIRLRRTQGVISYTDPKSETSELVPARMMLSDFTAHQATLYLTKNLPLETSVWLSFLQPSKLQIRATVVSVERLLTEKVVLSQHRFDFRTEVRLDIRTNVEAFALQKWLQVCTELLSPRR
jgi:hypothetical protein